MAEVQAAPRASPFAGTHDLAQTNDQDISKSRKIFRRITTKLRLPLAAHIPSPPSLPRIAPPPQAVNSFASKENRDAALRARGLLPPLRPNPDLSVQEAHQDRRFSVVLPVEENEDEVTAAKRIKEEWEARNRSPVSSPRAGSRTEPDMTRTRLNAFKFGGVSASASAPSLVVTDPLAVCEASARLQLSPVEEVTTPPLPSSSSVKSPASRSPSMRSNFSRASRPGPLDAPRKRSMPNLRPSPTTPLPPLPVDPEVSLALSVPLPPSPSPPILPASLEAHLVPLPPSPVPASLDSPSDTYDAYSIPLPPSPALVPSIPSPPNSVIPDTSGEETPKADIARQTRNPLEISASAFSPSSSPSLGTNDTLTPPRLLAPPSPTALSIGEASEETPSVSNASFTTPSLCVDNASQVNTISTFASTSESSSPGALRATLKVRPPEHAIPVILESPVEEAIVPSIVAGDEADAQHVIEPEKDASAAHMRRREPRNRSTTDPGVLNTAAVHAKRKSLGFFRRADGNVTDASSIASEASDGLSVGSNSKAQAQAKKRTSVSAAIKKGFRRSVIGNLTRSNKAAKGFDASHLPPSPTLPGAFGTQGPASPVLGADAATEHGEKAAGGAHAAAQASSLPANRSVPSLLAGRNPRRGATMPTPPPPPARGRLQMPLRVGVNAQESARRMSLSPPEPTSPRLALAPTMHNRASILIETNKIEDEESQRLSELAFLV
ncbi:hypothetical protein HGRIS_003408 [Hohenbuehelia grisea]|uniref:Proteophosphoglycan ppg4 n=1 Tax=Hohenbuehelia grisea TaxID=104357 RepID=A0ABR3JG84_9AGAR